LFTRSTSAGKAAIILFTLFVYSFIDRAIKIN